MSIDIKEFIYYLSEVKDNSKIVASKEIYIQLEQILPEDLFNKVIYLENKEYELFSEQIEDKLVKTLIQKLYLKIDL